VTTIQAKDKTEQEITPCRNAIYLFEETLDKDGAVEIPANLDKSLRKPAHEASGMGYGMYCTFASSYERGKGFD
jgi:hypothetical protein